MLLFVLLFYHTSVSNYKNQIVSLVFLAKKHFVKVYDNNDDKDNDADDVGGGNVDDGLLLLAI